MVEDCHRCTCQQWCPYYGPGASGTQISATMTYSTIALQQLVDNYGKLSSIVHELQHYLIVFSDFINKLMILYLLCLSSSTSRSHLVVGSLRQTQFSSSQFCHILHLSSFRWLSCMSRLTQSIHLCFGLPRFLLTGGTISRVFLPT